MTEKEKQELQYLYRLWASDALKGQKMNRFSDLLEKYYSLPLKEQDIVPHTPLTVSK